MKQLMKKSNIKYLIIFIIILAGIIMATLKGFNFDLNYEATQKVEIYIGKEFNVSDIKNITNEIFPNQDVVIEKVETFEDMVSIKAKEITDEQKKSIVTKINEKYELDNKAEEVNGVSVPHTRFIDIHKRYILPITMSLAIILVYVAIRYRKIGILKSLIKTIVSVVISEITLMSIVAISRIPVGRITTLLILFVYVISIICITSKLENQLILQKSKEEKE